MSDQTLVQLIGLIIGFAGTVLIWFFGVPRKELNRHGQQSIQDETDNEEMRDQWIKYDRFSHLGITLLSLSFVMQIIALFLRMS